MSPYTVVLLRPNRLCELDDEEYGKDVYIASKIDAISPFDAVCKAKEEAYAADVRDWGRKALDRIEIDPSDYELCVLFAGHHEPKAFGWDPIGRSPYRKDR